MTIEIIPVQIPDMVITHTKSGTIVRVINNVFETTLPAEPEEMTLAEVKAINKWQQDIILAITNYYQK